MRSWRRSTNSARADYTINGKYLVEGGAPNAVGSAVEIDEVIATVDLDFLGKPEIAGRGAFIADPGKTFFLNFLHASSLCDSTIDKDLPRSCVDPEFPPRAIDTDRQSITSQMVCFRQERFQLRHQSTGSLWPFRLVVHYRSRCSKVREIRFLSRSAATESFLNLRKAIFLTKSPNPIRVNIRVVWAQLAGDVEHCFRGSVIYCDPVQLCQSQISAWLREFDQKHLAKRILGWHFWQRLATMLSVLHRRRHASPHPALC